jgi:aspartyl-tRNA synthetase
MLRTHTCGEIRASHIGQTVTLSGWVQRRRDLGGLIFLDIRDRYGMTQIVINPSDNNETHKIGETIRHEYVIRVNGNVTARAEGQTNDDMPTGEIEIKAEKIEILSKAKTTPFEIGAENVREDLRLKYRYLDIRNQRMQKNLRLRHDIVKTVREYFYSEDFTEVETPIMVKGTPEGSREYLVPSRLHAGSFYVLPQSPQQLKQLLMVGGLDKYFQVARCFRDEDLRGDRQPEFTQFEIEASFVEQEDVINYFEDCFVNLTQKLAPQKEWKKFLVDGKFKRITWQAAMEKYGSDKPDLRFGMEFVSMSDEAKNSGFGVFEKSEEVYALKLSKTTGEVSRKDIDALTELAKKHGAGGLAWYRVGQESGAIAKFATEEFRTALIQKTNAEEGDIIFFGAGEFLTAVEPLGAVRIALGDKFSLRNPNEFAYAWVYNFPMFEGKDDGSVQAAHHPFTSPHPDDLALLDTDPMKARALAYDIVMNGVELGGGSIRIHDRDLQHKIFSLLGMDNDEIQKKFGHMLDAFDYGVPPHGGAAMGLDRVVMLFADEPNIREVIAFPKNQSAQDLMMGAPAPMPEKELQEQNIAVWEAE